MNFHRNTVYTSTARFDGTARALTEDELRALAPSIFAVTAHESRSERFAPIPTIEVLRGLAAEGFSVVGARQSTTRDEGKKDFTKHMVRLRRLDDKALKVNDSVFEILLKNANDGTSAYDLMAGLWRIVCSNSLVQQTANMDTIKVRHSGDVNAKVIEGTYTVLNNAENMLAAPADWSALNLSRDEKALFATAAHGLRFEPEEDGRAHPIQPSALLIPRRHEDTGADLWATFNVVQENAIRGGLTGKRIDAVTGQRRRTTTRAINGIDQDVKLNKALWVLAEGMAKLKKAN
jgi:hypothetical protein